MKKAMSKDMSFETWTKKEGTRRGIMHEIRKMLFMYRYEKVIADKGKVE
jgi:hypothetical protein